MWYQKMFKETKYRDRTYLTVSYKKYHEVKFNYTFYDLTMWTIKIGKIRITSDVIPF